MKKVLLALGLGLGTLFGASAQQTLEQATDSIRQIYIRAQQGNAVDQNEVGGWFYRGRHVGQDYAEALQWWTKAAAQDNAQAIGNMALCYQTGNGIERDSVRAVQLYQRSMRDGNEPLVRAMESAAAEGNVFAATLMASCYEQGIGVTRNKDRMMQLLEAAAEKGSVISETRLALAYLNKRDARNAFRWFERASEAGDINAAYYTGKLLLEGKGTAKDPRRGADILLDAAQRGHANAMFMLGECYINGDGVTRNQQQGSMWIAKACGQDLLKAEWTLARNYIDGIGVPVNYDRALYYFSRAAAGNYARTFVKLMTDSINDSPFATYFRGMKAYTAHDFEGAMEQFKKLARTDRAEGELMQGVILCNPDYAKNNLRKGIKLIRKSAETDPQAMYILGGLYEAGRGVDQNIAETVRLYTAAAEAGFGPAECALGDMYFEGRGVAQSYTKAVQWYNKAYETGQLNANAAHRLADCYENGRGDMERNPAKAAKINDGDYASRIAGLLRLL